MNRLFERLGVWRSVLVLALVLQVWFAEMIALPMPARADSDGYVAELQSEGVPIVGYAGPGRYIQAGYTICMELRSGASPATAAESSGFGQLYMWKQQLVTAAQHNLCPDTLPR